MPAGFQVFRSAVRRQANCSAGAARRGAISRLMLLVFLFAAVSCCLALMWVASRFAQSVPGTAASTARVETSRASEAPEQPSTGEVSASSVAAEAPPERDESQLSEAERERIRQLTLMFSEAQLAAPAPTVQIDPNVRFQPGADGYYDEEQEADLRAAGVEFRTRPVVEYSLPARRRETPSPFPDAGLPDPVAPAGPPTSGDPRAPAGPPQTGRQPEAAGPDGQQTLALWNQLNVIIEREAAMRAVPAGGVTDATADDFLARRAAASRYAAEAISELKIASVDGEVTRLAARLSQWYYAGINITETGRQLLTATPETRRGPRGQAWREMQQQHNSQVAELNSAAAEVREQMQQKYQLVFPPLK